MASLEPQQQEQTPGESMYDMKDEVVWFISVSKEPSWTQEKFLHEYQQVHANSVRIGHKFTKLPLHYDQICATELSGLTEEFYPGWDFVTALRWPSTYAVWAGFQDPMYQANAGKHIFCQLTQRGSIAKKFGELAVLTESRGEPGFSMLVFHHRSSVDDEASTSWLEQRLKQVPSLVNNHIDRYVIYKDITPKDTDEFFKGTQFDKGSWLLFKAVEQFWFGSQEEAADFLSENKSLLTGDGEVAPFITGGKVDVVIQ